MSTGTTTLTCGSTLNFYDNGGPSGNYSKNRSYTHTFNAPVGTRIRVHFTAFNLYSNNSGSKLDFYNLPAVSGDPARHCIGTTVPADFVSTGNVLTVYFESATRTASGWSATITVENCPEVLSSVARACGTDAITIGGGNINTAATAYSGEINRERTYTTTAGANITLTFTNIPEEGAQIEVFDGANSDARSVRTITSLSAVNATVVSSGNALTLRFTSDGTHNGEWAATLAPDPCFTQNPDVTIACGATQEIGGTYGANEYYATTYKCTDPNARMVINLTSLPNDGGDDYVEIYSGDLTTGSRMGRYHGDTTIVLYSSLNKLTVLFRSNNVGGGSWGASVSAVCPEVIASPADIACGASYVINETNAEYGNLQYTRQVFRAADANARLVFDFTALPEDSDHDRILVYDGEGATATLRGIYYRSGSTPSAIYSSSNVMTIEFLSNESVTGTWGARVSAICIDDLDEQSLGCDGAYAINSIYTNLQYTRQVFRATDPEAQVHLDFAVVNGSGVLPHDNANDYVEVYDGEGASMTLIGRYYGFGRPRTVSSVGPVMTVIFMSNSTVDGTWSAAVTVDCPDDINMPGPGGGHAEYTTCNATVYDDGGSSGNYSANLNNEYIVLRAGRPESVLYLEGEYNFDWQNDWITIYDGEPRIENGEPVFNEEKILWGGGHHGHGYPPGYAPDKGEAKNDGNHPSTSNSAVACGSDLLPNNLGPCDNCISGWPNPLKDRTGTVVDQFVADAGKTCVTYHPRVTSKTGSITIKFHTDGSEQCEGFEFHTYCIPKPTDCYNTGVVIFKQDFGGNVNNPARTAGVLWMTEAQLPDSIRNACSYTFTTGNNAQEGEGMTNANGHYAIRKTSCNHWKYFNFIDDHTHPGNIDMGYLFNVDANQNPGYFYKDKINLKCDGVDRLLVSFWAANINNERYYEGSYPNITMGFYSDEACTHLLAERTTGPIPPMTTYGCISDANEWQYYQLELPTIEYGTRQIWFRIANNTGTNDGNDFVIDDIEVRACLPPSILTRIGGEHEIFSSANVCAGEQLRLLASLDETLGAQSRYPTPYYAWERGEEVTDPNDPNYPIRWTRMNFGDYGREGEWATCDTCERLAFTNCEDISYGPNDGFENYNDITIVEVPSPTAPAY
ncbi:MAG: hypothetical protein II060_13490, partial [Bacteroidales bacterium]|nr:hypothetical protein [Bacteroidales bacterium]